MSTDIKLAASLMIEKCRAELSGLGDHIWRHPELGFEEHQAHQLLTDFLERKGFKVERSFGGLETAFRATFGSGRPNVCVISEYDALPDIGHACGHNLIAEAGVAAGLGLKAALECDGAPKGMVTVLGTPAEETTGGKLDLIKRGAFNEIDIAMMVHPSSSDIVSPVILGVSAWEVTFTGKTAHAAAYPWEGVNALDAAVMAYNFVSVLRQQLKPTWRVHGVALHGGGTDPAVIPASTTLLYYVRAPLSDELAELEKKVMGCFEAAAEATGCTVSINPGMKFETLVSNPRLAQCYADNLRRLGESFEVCEELSISTDFGDVSHVVPSIHPMYRIGATAGEGNHTVGFAAAANAPEAHERSVTMATAMAHTCIDVLMEEGLLEAIKQTHKQTQTLKQTHKHQ